MKTGFDGGWLLRYTRVRCLTLNAPRCHSELCVCNSPKLHLRYKRHKSQFQKALGNGINPASVHAPSDLASQRQVSTTTGASNKAINTLLLVSFLGSRLEIELQSCLDLKQRNSRQQEPNGFGWFSISGASTFTAWKVGPI